MTVHNTQLEHAAIDLIIFDCDGVLIDSETLSKRVLLSMLDELGVQISYDYFERYFLGQSFTSVTAKVLEDYAVLLDDGFRQDYLAALLLVFADELKPTHRLVDMLSQLKTPVCVATSSSPTRVSFALKTVGLQHYFGQKVFTCSEVKNGKPAPDVFLHAAEKMGVAPHNCLVIEDSQAGIKGAQAANMHVIKYAGASHLNTKGVSSIDIANKVHTIFEWEELLTLLPSLMFSK